MQLCGIQLQRYCIMSIGFPDKYFWTFKGLLRFWLNYRRSHLYSYHAYKWDGDGWKRIIALPGGFYGKSLYN